MKQVMVSRRQNSLLSKVILAMFCLVIILYFQKINLENKLQKTLKKNKNIHEFTDFRRHLFENKILGILDSSGYYMVYSNVVSSTLHQNEKDVTIATHCSVENIFYLQNLVKHWHGFISVSIYTNDPATVFRLINLFRNCDKKISDFVTFHIVTPINSVFVIEKTTKNNGTRFKIRFKENHDLINFSPDVECKNMGGIYKEMKSNWYNYAQIYPSNLQRNTALNAVLTQFVLNLDIDILPSENLRKDFQSFILSKKFHMKTIYILPAFEVQKEIETGTLILNKKTIQELLGQQKCRQFYVELCEHCHNCTEYNRWLAIQPYEAPLDVAYSVTWRHSFEPFYIAHKYLLPRFDEQFTGYGYNRVSQVCELHISGWDFQVLHPAFVVHVGYKKFGDHHFNKPSEMKRNFKKYLNFINDCAIKYPNSNKTCKITS